MMTNYDGWNFTFQSLIRHIHWKRIWDQIFHYLAFNRVLLDGTCVCVAKHRGRLIPQVSFASLQLRRTPTPFHKTTLYRNFVEWIKSLGIEVERGTI